MSTDAIIVKFPRQGSENYTIFKQPLVFPTIPQSFVMSYFTMLGYIFGIDCQTTLQVQERLISSLPVEIYVKLRCYCCVRILAKCPDTGQHTELCKNINFAMETKVKKVKQSFVILRTK